MLFCNNLVDKMEKYGVNNKGICNLLKEFVLNGKWFNFSLEGCFL